MGQTEAAVLLNSASGGSQSVSEASITSRFGAVGISAQVIVLHQGQSPAEALRAAREGTTVFVAGGGDGTVSAVAAALAGTDNVLGVLPVGTLNHFAKDLGIPRKLDDAVAVIARGRIARIDVGRVNDRVFVNNASLGMYPGIVEAREALRREGHPKWAAMARAVGMMLRRDRGILVRITTERGSVVRQTPFVFVGNNEYVFEGAQLGTRASLDSGRLFAYLTPRVRASELPMVLVRALLRRPETSQDLEIVSAPEISVDMPSGGHVSIALDGETTTMTTPLIFRSWPGALRVLVPEG